MATAALDVTNEVMAAVYAVLNVSSITAEPPTGYSCPVHEDVPQGEPFPYIRLSDVSARGETVETMGRAGDDVLVQVSVFSQEEGGKQARTIRKEAHRLLHNATLSVSGATFISCREESRGDGGLEEIDGVKTYHKFAQFRVLTQAV